MSVINGIGNFQICHSIGVYYSVSVFPAHHHKDRVTLSGKHRCKLTV